MGLLDFVFAPKIEKLKAERDVIGLIKALRSGNFVRKRDAAKALGEIKDARAVEPLIEALNDNYLDVRGYAAGALGEIKDIRAVEPLIKALNDIYLEVSKYAAKALCENKDTRYRLGSYGLTLVKALGEIKDIRSVEPLIVALNDKDGQVREYAAKALCEIKDARAVEPLIKALDDGNFKVRKYAAEALDKIINAQAVELLIKALNDKNPYARNYAIRALGEIKDTRAVEPLIKALYDDNRQVRRDVVKALGEIKDARAIEPLIKALYDDNRHVRGDVVKALGEIGDARAVEPLIKALNDDGHHNREYAEEALDKIKDARAVEPLIKALNDNSSYVRNYAVKALGEIKDVRAVEPLIVFLNYGYFHYREYAAKALGEIKDARAVEPLIKALNDDDGTVRGYAAKALGEIKDARAVEPLIKALKNNFGMLSSDHSARKSAAEALGEIKDARAVEPLIKALKDNDAYVRGYAVEALIALGESAVEPLKIASEDKNSNVRANAKKALYEIKTACNIMLSNGDAQPVPCVPDTAKNIQSIPEPKNKKTSLNLELTRTVFDPVAGGFVSEEKLDYPEISKWLSAHPPPDYWYILRIDNPGNTIEQWAVELETDIALSVKEAYIDGFERSLSLNREHMQWKDKYVLRVPRELANPLSSNCVKRLYFRLNIDCNIALQARYAISGNVKADNDVVPIEKKSFSFSCRLRELKELCAKNPEKVENYVNEKALELYSQDAARAITYSFKLYDEINKIVEKERYVDESTLKAKLENLLYSLENVKKFTGVENPVKLVETSITIMYSTSSAEHILKSWKDMNLFDVMMTELLKGRD